MGIKENLIMIGEFYKNRKVLITGHTGFKGSWLTIWLKSIGADVTGIALGPQTENTLFNLSGIGSAIKDYRQDIRDYNAIFDLFEAEKPEIVFHLAAQSLVLTGYKEPLYTYQTNILGTVNILEAIRKTPSVRAAVMVTSDKCYNNSGQSEGYREQDSMGGEDPYSSSKGAAELVIKAYQSSYFSELSSAAIASARAGNVIGGGDWADDRVIPDCVKSFEKGESVLLRNPSAIRPWQHVLEPLGAYMYLASKLFEEGKKYASPWNFGPPEEDRYSVQELVESFIGSFGGGSISYDNSKHAKEAKKLSLNISKARDQLGWQPILGFNEAVQLTADWYKRYKYEDIAEITMEQINKFTGRWNLLKEK